MEEFGDVKEDEVNQSIVSEKGLVMQEKVGIYEDKERKSEISEEEAHGMDEFGEVGQEEVNQSITS